ncbi:molybdenum cofactor biosynthesis protein A [Corynebacterium kutscheri]|uniref:GTP 3',8-cyclase n=1 Tax=Corynebacterium kutscheri TaxID=35755 RepID=A0A0F6R1C9_9CORY|nr:GTP 3',8-cyclase MoaA [Corynebacterium kutscheri]AKE42252.1 molybdenum cofactor biosynthesis protein A [Corynebacterium kutscheri]VEH05673.1 molybdenum cofactor biosynthesis protein A [Corynebacterium kutscheri]VEH10595.1 molybdenum cofactor biosynthesis protein A [Corynebacterium kutscheri]VEH81568.1 molybdenum cofactor biosynthesis protein A [Corynebacterium kutscheri]
MTHHILSDAYGRVARDLRVSLTDRCNLRCTYCMPAEGMQWLPREETLSDSEINRLLRIAAQNLGITRVRFTGGEPLLRPGLENIIRYASKLGLETALTTNGLGLDKRVHRFIEAGLDRVNISLDSLDSHRYAALTRRDRLKDVLRSIEITQKLGVAPIKINTVIMRGTNEQDILPLAHFSLERGLQLRFIEQMPLGPQEKWNRSNMVTAQEILSVLQTRYTLSPIDERGSAPAQLWRVHADNNQPGGKIGVIASVTNSFCQACDRTRLTSDGTIRSCLFSQEEIDLRAILRSGGNDDEIIEAWVGAHKRKPRAHGINTPTFIQPERTMSAIGG